MFQRLSLVRSCLGVLAFCCLSSPAYSGMILSDNFNGTGGVPKNWIQILGATGDIKETPNNLTITDSTGHSAGIASSLASSVFNPQGVVTTITAKPGSTLINSVNSKGNAIFGLIGLDKSGAPIGDLAAGIDAGGHVFIVEQQPGLNQTIVPIGQITTYTGGSILLDFIINATGVEVKAPSFKFDSGPISFSKDLNNFSLAAAFPNGAIPALVGASQPTETGGVASFASIQVSTALGASAVPEPSTLTLLTLGSLGLIGYGWRRRKPVAA